MLLCPTLTVVHIAVAVTRRSAHVLKGYYVAVCMSSIVLLAESVRQVYTMTRRDLIYTSS